MRPTKRFSISVHRVLSRASVARQRHTAHDGRPLPPLQWLGKRYGFDAVVHFIPSAVVAPPAAVVRTGNYPPEELVAVLTGPDAESLFQPLREDGDRRLRDADLVLYPEYTKRGDAMRAAMGGKPFGLPLGAEALAGLERCTPMATAVPWSRGSSTNIRTPFSLVCSEHLLHQAHAATSRVTDSSHIAAVRQLLHNLGLHPSEAAMAAAPLTPPPAEERTLLYLPGGRRTLHGLYQDDDFVYVAPRGAEVLLSPHRDSTIAMVPHNTNAGTAWALHG